MISFQTYGNLEFALRVIHPSLSFHARRHASRERSGLFEVPVRGHVAVRSEEVFALAQYRQRLHGSGVASEN